MKKPMINERSGKFQITFWDESGGGRKQKTVGSGENALKNAKCLQQAFLNGVLTYKDVSSKAKCQELLTLVKKRKAASRMTPAPNPEIRQVSRSNKDNVTFGEAVSSYLSTMEDNDRAEKSIDEIKKVAENKFFKLIPPDKPLSTITEDDDVRPFIKFLKSPVHGKENNKPLSKVSVNRYLCYLRSILNYSVRKGWIDISPLRFWRQPKETPRRFEVTLDDVAKILQYAAHHVALAIQCLYYLGIRHGELLSLKWEAINFDKGTVFIHATKTKSDRVIPIHPVLLDILRREKAVSKSEYVISYKGHQLTSIYHGLQKALRRSGLSMKVRPNDLRHMFASYALTTSGDVTAVSKMMGHASTKMVMDVYSQVVIGAQQRVIEQLPQIPLPAAEM